MGRIDVQSQSSASSGQRFCKSNAHRVGIPHPARLVQDNTIIPSHVEQEPLLQTHRNVEISAQKDEPLGGPDT